MYTRAYSSHWKNVKSKNLILNKIIRFSQNCVAIVPEFTRFRIELSIWRSAIWQHVAKLRRINLGSTDGHDLNYGGRNNVPGNFVRRVRYVNENKRYKNVRKMDRYRRNDTRSHIAGFSLFCFREKIFRFPRALFRISNERTIL